MISGARNGEAAAPRSQITSGQISPGRRVQSKVTLCHECDVSQTTVEHALRLLAGEGLIAATQAKARLQPQSRRHSDPMDSCDFTGS